MFKFLSNKRGEVTRGEREIKVEPKCKTTSEGMIQNRGETGKESTQLFYQMCQISKICKCLSVQMIFGAIGTLAGLMMPPPRQEHSEDVIHPEKTHPFLSPYIRQQRKLKWPRVSPLLRLEHLLIYFIICSEVSFFKHFFKKMFLFFFYLMSRTTAFPPGQESKGSLMFYRLVSASCFSLK